MADTDIFFSRTGMDRGKVQKTVDEALAIKNTDIVNELSLPPVKIHCSVLAEDAIKAAIDDYKKKAEKLEAQANA